jgi:hypothetical protein
LAASDRRQSAAIGGLVDVGELGGARRARVLAKLADVGELGRGRELSRGERRQVEAIGKFEVLAELVDVSELGRRAGGDKSGRSASTTSSASWWTSASSAAGRAATVGGDHRGAAQSRRLTRVSLEPAVAAASCDMGSAG